MTNPDLAAIIEEFEGELLEVKERFAVLCALEQALKAVAVDDKFRLRNDIVYGMATDSYHALFIRLASLCRNAYSPGGFLKRVGAHRGSLRKPNRSNEDVLRSNCGERALSAHAAGDDAVPQAQTPGYGFNVHAGVRSTRCSICRPKVSRRILAMSRGKRAIVSTTCTASGKAR